MNQSEAYQQKHDAEKQLHDLFNKHFRERPKSGGWQLHKDIIAQVRKTAATIGNFTLEEDLETKSTARDTVLLIDRRLPPKAE